jgi:1,4-dihydroxy-2-naphthoate octaprenyltransferase
MTTSISKKKESPSDRSLQSYIDFSERTWRDVAKGLFMEIRILPVLVWAFTAISLGTVLAYAEHDVFLLKNFSFAMLIACLVQAYPTHAANEIVDWLSGTDIMGLGGSKVVREGLLSIKDLKIILLASITIVIILSTVVILTIDMRLIWFGIVGIAASLFYSLPPVKLAYKPFLGEWIGGFVGVFVAVTGSYFIQVQSLSTVVILAGIALGISDIAIMEMFHTIDYQADKEAIPQKRTTIVYLGRERGQLYVIANICFAAVIFWLLTLQYWQFLVWSVMATGCIFFYRAYDPTDPWSIIKNTKKVTWSTIGAGLLFASAVNAWFSLLITPVILGYFGHKKWGKLSTKSS